MDTTRYRRLSDEARVALGELARAYTFAENLQVDSWEFAVAIGRLISLGATESDLRWLAFHGHAEHARETTACTSMSRRFRPTCNLSFSERTCFVLTHSGAMLARAATAAATGDPRLVGEAPPPPPQWDRQRRVLRVGGCIVKHYRLPSPNQEAILSAFQEEGWPCRIDDPLPHHEEHDSKYRLKFTIHRLNDHQKHRLLRFSGDGTGEGVCWEHVPADVLAGDASRDVRRAA
jgi:hypothetical protein